MKTNRTKHKPQSSNPKPRLTAAVKRAEGLVQSLKAAHAAACTADPLLAMVLTGRLESAVTLQRKLGEIAACVR